MDALHEANWKSHPKKDGAESAAPSAQPPKSAGNKLKAPFLSSKQEPSFTSFLMGNGEEGRSQDSSTKEGPPSPKEHFVRGSRSTLTRM